MFLFIENGIYSDHAGVTNLNTSHVLIYRGYTLYKTPPLPQFKYISCSYLSLMRIKSGKILNYLNTSHVLIYHPTNCPGANFPLFKYISCSYLSIRCKQTKSKQYPFKYISCSYLSLPV